MGRLWRVYQPELPDEPGSVVSIGPEESRHLRKVLRLREGDPVAVFDGAGREFLARLEGGEGSGITLRIEREVTEPAVEAPLAVALYQGLLRPERMDWVVQKATEIGVAAVYPFPAERAEAGRVGADRLRRWRRIAVESCKQSGRRRLTRIEPVSELPAAEGEGTLGLVLHPSADSRPLTAACPASSPASLCLAVGPQGGFAPEEVEQAAAKGWIPTGLGPRVLRADTAGVVAAAILLHRWADLGR